MLPMMVLVLVGPFVPVGSCADSNPTPAAEKEMVQAVQSQGNFESKSNTSENKLIEEIKKLKREGVRVQFENNALRAMVAGDYSQSVSNFSEAIERGDPNPETYKLYSDRAAAHMRRNDYTAAYKDFSEAIYKTEAFVKEGEGQINTTTGKPVDLSWAAGLLAYYYNERGMANVFAGRYKEAIPDFDKALSLRPKTAKTLKDKSRALAHLKRYADSAKAYDEAIAADPKSKSPGDAKLCRSLAENGQKAAACN